MYIKRILKKEEGLTYGYTASMIPQVEERLQQIETTGHFECPECGALIYFNTPTCPFCQWKNFYSFETPLKK